MKTKKASARGSKCVTHFKTVGTPLSGYAIHQPAVGPATGGVNQILMVVDAELAVQPEQAVVKRYWKSSTASLLG
jgi:hypothetical protein